MNLKKVLSLTSAENVYFITEYIVSFLKSNNLSYKIDGLNNIYITKGESDVYPCLTAHLDTVHDFGPVKVVEKNGVFTSPIGIGGDDKVGVFVCLSLLKQLDVVKVVFFNGEERGCIGSKDPWVDFFKDIGYVIAIDRRGNSDYINEYWGGRTTSEDFDETIWDILKKYNYKATSGLITDVFTLMDNGTIEVCGCNFSCGYYNPHTINEYVVASDVYRTLKMLYKIVKRLGNKRHGFIFEPKAAKYVKNKYYNKRAGYFRKPYIPKKEADAQTKFFNGQQGEEEKPVTEQCEICNLWFDPDDLIEYDTTKMCNDCAHYFQQADKIDNECEWCHLYYEESKLKYQDGFKLCPNCIKDNEIIP